MLKIKKLFVFIFKTQTVPVNFSLLATLFSGPYSLVEFAGMIWLMTLTVPFTVGSLCIYFSKRTSAKSIPYIIFMPWLPIVITLTAAIYLSDAEGRFLLTWELLFAIVLSSLGGIFGAYIKLKEVQ